VGVEEMVDEAAWWDSADHAGEMADAIADLDLEAALYRALAAALCRRVAHLLPHPAFADAIPLVERWAAGQLSDDDRWAAWERLGEVLDSLPGIKEFGLNQRPDAGYSAAYAVHFALWSDVRGCHGRAEGVWHVMIHVVDALATAAGAPRETSPHFLDAERAEYAAQAVLMREIFGNPFRPAGEGDQVRD
jgi:hypothetical protein